MVLGLKSKSRKGPSVNVEYVVHLQEIKPWPPSHSLKSLRSVFLQWENGDRSSGSTKSVVPSLGTGVGDGKIEFNESFRIPVVLSRELSIKGDTDAFQKNCMELNLYELRSNKNVKGQLLGTVIIDFAEYGVLKETRIANAPVNCKRSFRNTAQPVLFMKIEPFNKRNSRSSSRENLSKEASLDKDGRESVSALMNRDSDDEAEIASFTDDDDVSQHSSLTVSSSAFEATGDSPPQENVSEAMPDKKRANFAPDVALESEDAKSDSNADVVSEIYANNSSQKSDPKFEAQEVHERTANESSVIKQDTKLQMKGNNTSDLEARVASLNMGTLNDDTSCLPTSAKPRFQAINVKKAWVQSSVDADGTSETRNSQAELKAYGDVKQQIASGHVEHIRGDDNNAPEAEASDNYSSNVIKKPEESVEDVNKGQKDLDVNNSLPTISKLKHVKSVRSLSQLESGRNKRFENNNHLKEINSLEDAHCIDGNLMQNGEKNDIALPKEVKNNLADSKVQQLDHRIERLEIELREAAALEVALYSVVAEHGSSANKVHAPARRLSRLYLHAWKCSKLRASAARSAVSGLVLVAKACGNDVPRLTFWLSNSVVLRAIISLHLGDSHLPVSAGPHSGTNDGEKRNDRGHSLLKWEEFSSSKKQNTRVFSEDIDAWEEPHTFMAALEKIESWIFSRIIESVWWQTLTPHMQSASNSNEEKIYLTLRNSYGRRNSLSDQDQANFSMELWKKAFKDACERLCPIRAAGHECGCLPVLARLVMEQCVNRLDVAMFNAILRESADDIPTDPVSDPISDSKVLPIPAGKSSFGAGAQLKNAIGNWSRWLTDLFGIDDDDSHEVQTDLNEDDLHECDTSSKSFHLLNALSDLMMLPKDMLLSRSIRKEVCPAFGAPLIKRILNDFSPDEFCPDPIPAEVFQALDTEDSLHNEEESICNFPCNAAPVIYLPPPAALLASFVGESGKESHLRRSGSSVLRKSYTSDDELDELDSPLSSITDSFRKTSTSSWKAKVVRYELLQEVWREGD